MTEQYEVKRKFIDPEDGSEHDSVKDLKNHRLAVAIGKIIKDRVYACEFEIEKDILQEFLTKELIDMHYEISEARKEIFKINRKSKGEK